MIKDLKTVKEKVKILLEKHPKLKDSDSRLIATFWGTELKWASMSGFDVLKAIADGKVTSAEAIRRTRQKLNEYHPETRGLSWRRRHEKEVTIKEEIRNL